MEFDPTNPLQQNRHEISTDRALTRKYFNLEVDFMVAPYYSKEPKFIIIRSAALPYIEKLTCDQPDAMVGYLALNYLDRFLSRNSNIPVVLQGFGFERNLELFVFCCVSIAFKLRSPDFLFTWFWNKHRKEIEDDVLVMEREILKGLNQKVRPVTAMTFSYILQQKLKKEHQKQVLPNSLVSRLIVEIQKDMRFTEFRPSTVAASVILVTSYIVRPDMYSKFKHSIYNFGCVNKIEVKACLDELKTHEIADYILNPKRQPEVLIEMSGLGVGKMKRKKVLIKDSLMERVLNCFGVNFGSFRI